MKKIKSLSESDFLKLLFFLFSLAFLIASLCMPDRGELFAGMGRILSQPCKISTNYFALGGYAATFFNMGLVALICTALYVALGAAANNVSTLAFFLTLGFCSWGINPLNILPTMLGVALYCAVKKQPLKTQVNTMLFSTGIAPLIMELMVRYPDPETVGFTPGGMVLALAAGFAIGFFLPAGLANAPKVHHGMDLYNAAVPIGMTAFFLQGILFKTMGVPLAAVENTLNVASRMTVNSFCIAVFSLCALGALILGCRPGAYWKLLMDDTAPSYSAAYGNAALLMNIGVYGLFILLYYNLVGASFNGVTFGLIFCMLACCNSGSNPRTVLPIMAAYVLGSLVFSRLSALAGGDFSSAVNAQAILTGLCYANGLSPLSRKYGWQYAFLGGLMHYLMVTTVPSLHGGFCLYNGGFTAAFVCLLLVPVLQHFCREKEVHKV